MARKKQNASPVGQPLTPTVMTEVGGLRAPPPPAEDFAPQRDWIAWYRIWTCYGHRSQGNVTAGALRIARQGGADGFQLDVRQTLRNSEGKLHTIRATVQCGRDALGSPASWTLHSEFTGSRMDGLPAMGLRQSGRIRGQAWEVTADGKMVSRQVDPPVAADWCLFEAVQRMPFRQAAPLKFALLEGLSVLKKDHRLSYCGRLTETWGPERLPLHCFVQLGRGVYPYEYWLDDLHRLLLVTTGPRAYVLDPQAEQALAPGGTKP